MRRGGADIRGQYYNAVKRANRGVNKKMVPQLVAQSMDNKNMDSYGNFDKEERSAHQDKALGMFQSHLSAMSEDPDAMDALRQSANSLYAPMGEYSEQNKGGITGGKLGYANHAMNDVLLRSLASDTSTGREDFQLDDFQKKGALNLASAMMSMQSKVMTHSGKESDSPLSPQELELSQMLKGFYQQHGLVDPETPAEGLQESASALGGGAEAAPAAEAPKKHRHRRHHHRHHHHQSEAPVPEAVSVAPEAVSAAPEALDFGPGSALIQNPAISPLQMPEMTALAPMQDYGSAPAYDPGMNLSALDPGPAISPLQMPEMTELDLGTDYGSAPAFNPLIDVPGVVPGPAPLSLSAVTGTGGATAQPIQQDEKDPSLLSFQEKRKLFGK